MRIAGGVASDLCRNLIYVQKGGAADSLIVYHFVRMTHANGDVRLVHEHQPRATLAGLIHLLRLKKNILKMLFQGIRLPKLYVVGG